MGCHGVERELNYYRVVFLASIRSHPLCIENDRKHREGEGLEDLDHVLDMVGHIIVAN